MKNVTKYLRTFFMCIVSFTLGCILALHIVLTDKSCDANRDNREYRITRNIELKNPELIVIILSAPKNLDKRTAIRETWLDLDTRNLKYKYKHYFVIGSLGLSADEILHISAEQSQFNDLLLLPLYDSYENLTEKLLKSFKWLNLQYEYGLKFKYVLKCDDDTFINIPLLLMEILQLERYINSSNLTPNQFITINFQKNKGPEEAVDAIQSGIYWGYFHGSASVKTRGKWKETDWIFCDKYLPYALGGGYILSVNLVAFLGKNAQDLRTFKSEDVSIGLWLSSYNNIFRVHDIRFDTEWKSRGCKNYYLVTHNRSIKEMKNMYENLLFNNKQLCTKEEENRKSYLYNWSKLASQCCLTAS